jgi:superoxide dismutase, Cu-Zn family
VTLCALFCCVLSGCMVEEVPEADTEKLVGTASIVPKSGNATLVGTVFVTELAGEIALTLEIEGAPAGKHGVHLHQVGDCSAADASSAGPHWNPAGHMHGMPESSSHLGDLGNMIVREDGVGKITIQKPEWTAGDGSDHDVLGKALVFHANVDDFSDPAGNSGPRIGCGVIEAVPQ